MEKTTKEVAKPVTIETRIEALTQQMNKANQDAATANMIATKCAGAIEALTAVLNDQKKK